MKTKQHGKGLSHKQVVEFSNLLAYAGTNKTEGQCTDLAKGFDMGWEACALYFAHMLRYKLRKEEQQ